MNAEQVQQGVDRAMHLVPTEDDGWDEETQPYAEDSAAAVAYALRARLSGDPQEAAWAGRRVYEAADHFAGAAAGVSATSPAAELVALSHHVVQGELARQKRDLAELLELAAGTTSGGLVDMRQRSEQEALSFFATSS